MRRWTIIVAATASATGVTPVAMTAVAEEPERDAIRILRIEPEEAIEVTP